MSFTCEISLSDIVDYLKDSNRPLKEGENLYVSGHVVKIGVTRLTGAGAELIGFVIQTSNIRGAPHQVNIRFRNKRDWTIVKCSCKAGLGLKCKHAVAVLLCIQSAKVIEAISSTELKQTWGKPVGKKFDHMYGAKKQSKLCCPNRFKQRTTHVPDDVREKFDNVFLSQYLKISTAAVTIHRERRQEYFHVSPPPIALNLKIESLLREQLCQSDQILLAQPLPQLSSGILDFYSKCIDVNVDMVLSIESETRSQSNIRWYSERQKRITASTAYQLFTYARNKSPNWPQKAIKYTSPNNIKTAAMQHGHDFESAARQKYAEHTNNTVDVLGFVVSSVLPWLGCSPDGIVFNKKKVVEIKCPLLGKTTNLDTMLKSCHYLDQNMHLKTNHAYYAQVQLIMAVLNATVCDFVIYCSSDGSFLLIEIPFDHVYFNSMLNVLSNIYFTHLLSAICEKNT